MMPSKRRRTGSRLPRRQGLLLRKKPELQLKKRQPGLPRRKQPRKQLKLKPPRPLRKFEINYTNLIN